MEKGNAQIQFHRLQGKDPSAGKLEIIQLLHILTNATNSFLVNNKMTVTFESRNIYCLKYY